MSLPDRLPLTFSLALAAAAWSLPAHAQACPAELERLRGQVVDQESAGLLWRTGLQGELRTLYQTARSLDAKGNDSGCLEIVAVIVSIMGKATIEGGEADTGTWQEERLASLIEANAAAQQAILGLDSLMENNLRNAQDEYLGEIEDIVLADGLPRYAIVGRGGLFGVGEEQIAVPWELLRVTQGEPVLVLDVTPEQLEAAPSFSQDEWARFNDERFTRENAAFYEQAIAD